MSRNKSKAWTQASGEERRPSVPPPNRAGGGVSFDPVLEQEPVAVVERPAPPRQLSHEEDPYLTQSDVAIRLGVTHTTVGNYIRTRLLKAEYRGGRLCVRESALAAFQGKNYEPPKGE